MTVRRHIGGSILPSNDRFILQPMAARHGVFQVVVLAARDTHALHLDGVALAEHPNGYSCHALAERISAVWNGTHSADYAIQQFDFILACGGRGRRSRLVQALNLKP